MKKRFKSRRKIKHKNIFLIITILLSFIFVYKNINKYDLSFIKKINLDGSSFLIKYSLGQLDNNDRLDSDTKPLGDYVEDITPQITSSNPVVYIYNTHQTESYNKDVVEPYNISPTVMITSYMLRENLEKLGISSIVEQSNIKNVLNEHNWIYKDSYKASRILLENAFKNNPSLKIFIDIHRDSSLYKNTTYIKDNISYAKILFVVGLDYQGYEENLNCAVKLNNIFKKDHSNLTRGIYKKSGKGVNGIYNQNFKNNTFLIEVGGQYNSIEEVKNTIGYLAESIATYIKENVYEKEI